MKTLNFLSVLVIFLLFASLQTNANGLRSGFSNYKIEPVDQMVPGKDVEKVWNLTYNNSEKPVVVVKRNCAEGVFYMVNTEYFEVCYGCTSKGFGIGTVRNAWSCVPSRINEVVLNAEEMKKQKVILPWKVEDEKALGLIASYLPNLLNEEYIHLLN